MVKAKRDPKDRYRLVDDQDRSVEDANRFLVAVETRGLSPRTVEAYAFDLVVIYRWLATIDRQLPDLVESDLGLLITAERERGTAPRSINRRVSTCGSIFRFVVGRPVEQDRRGVVPPGPHYRGSRRSNAQGTVQLGSRRAGRLRVKVPYRLEEPLTQSQARQFLRSLRRYRDIAIVHLMLLCGLRSLEILRLRLGDLDFDARRIRVQGKGDKERVLPIPDLVADSVRRYLDLERPAKCASDSLFVVLQGKRRGLTMSRAGLRRIFRSRRSKREIANANPHRFRHTFGIDMAREGVRLPILQKMMGHTHVETTLRYINLSMADVAEEYRRAVAEIEKRY